MNTHLFYLFGETKLSTFSFIIRVHHPSEELSIFAYISYFFPSPSSFKTEIATTTKKVNTGNYEFKCSLNKTPDPPNVNFVFQVIFGNDSPVFQNKTVSAVAINNEYVIFNLTKHTTHFEINFPSQTNKQSLNNAVFDVYIQDIV